MERESVRGSNPDLELINTLRRKVEGALRPFLERRTVALLDFPAHSNVGDSAIWLGETELLRSLEIRPRYVCDDRTYSRSALADAVRNGVTTLLLHGGGNLGDIYTSNQRLRLDVINAFRNCEIIQLPQTLHFDRLETLEETRRVFDRHPNLTLFLRDLRSLEIARREFRAASFLCPDTAFWLGPLKRPATPTQAVVWLARSDGESAFPADLSRAVEPVDWLAEETEPLVWLQRQLGRSLKYVWNGTLLRRPFAQCCDFVARRRVRRGCRLLSLGKTVVTDRLHGHILCLLLGIPHMLLDNRYGKIRAFHETWTRGSNLAWWCDTPEAALERALSGPREQAAELAA
jgi:exopolysaccharide biosynthesis predicted pyruvyltransferase EpsI